MRDPVWRLIERRLRRVLPRRHAASALGDLAEDYAARRASHGFIPSRLWLVREARSLSAAYRTAAAAGGDRRGPRPIRFFADLRHASRRLAARPAPAVFAAALLAIGIGLATAMFSVVDALLLRPAPFKDADRLVRQGQWRAIDRTILDAWSATGLFEVVEGSATEMFQDEPTQQSVSGAWVTPGMFELLGVKPLRGRVFGPADAGRGSSDLVVLSEVLWRSTFGSDPHIFGTRLTLAGSQVVVVGIMPTAFQFPAPTTMVWRLMDAATFPDTTRSGEIFARMKPGVPRAVAEARGGAIARALGRLPRNYGGDPPLHVLGVSGVNDFTRRALWLLLGGVSLVFLVLCANVSSLVLSHLSARRREFGLCSALGASRWRLVREAAVEHALVGIAGVAAGVLLARYLTTIVPELFVGQTLNPIDLDPRALAAASTLGVAAVIVSGLVPAWLGTRADPLDSIRGSAHAGTETRGARVASRGLLVAEIALACSLLVGSAVLMQSFVNLVQRDRGLDIEGMTHVRVSGLRASFPSLEAMRLGLKALEGHVSAWPETAAMALSQEIPPVSGAGGGSVSADTPWIKSDGYRVSATFFSLYRIPLLRGRTFDATDTEGAAIIGERLAHLLWPHQDPVGRSFRLGIMKIPRRVIGLVGEITLPTVNGDADRPEYYEPLEADVGSLYLSLRCRAGCPDEPEIRRRIQAVQPSLSPRIYSPERDYLYERRLPRAIAQIAGAFSIVAVVTAAGGLFSVLTSAVGRRRHEFGIRAALGASPRQMRHIVFRDGFGMVAAGVVAGAGGGWLAARALAAFQYGVTAADPVVWVAVIGTMTMTAFVAAWRPALQAMRTDPVKLLREE